MKNSKSSSLLRLLRFSFQLSAFSFLLATSSQAATAIWDGAAGAPGNWNADNWSGGGGTGGAPVANDILQFSGNGGTAGPTTVNNFTAATQFGSGTGNAILFTNNGTGGVTNTAFSLSGNSITLGGNIVATSSTAAIQDTIANDLLIGASREVTAAGNHTIALTGNITINGPNNTSLTVNNAAALSGAGGAINLNSTNASIIYNNNTDNASLTLSRAINANSGAHLYNNSANTAATLTYTGAFTGTANTFVLNGTNTGANDFQSAIGGTAILLKSGVGSWTNSGLMSSTNVNGVSGVTGNLTLSNNNNTYTGATLVTAGTLNIATIADYGTASAVGKGTSGTALRLGNNNTSGILNYTGAGNTSNRTIQIGAGTVNTHTGNATIQNNGSNGGTGLKFTATTSSTAFNSPVASTTANRTLTLGGTNTDANEIQGKIQDNTAITGLVAVTKAGTGRWILSGNNTYTGNTTVNGGVLNIQSATALGSTANGTSVASGAALQIQGNIIVGAEALALNGTGISADGALRNISGSNTYGGNITLAGATRINSDAGTLTLNGTATITGATFALTVGGAGNTTITSAIGTTTGTLTKDGSGTLTLSGANTYSGTTTVTAGTLQYGANGVISTGAVTINGGTLDMVSYTDTVGALSISSNSTLKMAANQTGAAQLISTGEVSLAGALDLTGMSTSAGLYKLVAGTSLTGTFATTNGLGNYSLLYSGTELDAQHKADQAFSSPTGTFSIITGGTQAVSATLTNGAPSGSAALAVSLADNSGTGGAVGSLSASTGSTVVVGTPATVNGNFTAGTSIGAGKTWSISNTDANAVTNPASTSGTVNVYDHAAGSVAGGALTLGNIHAGYAGNATSSNSDSVSNASGYRVNLSGSAAPSGNISLNSVSGLTANGTAGTITATLAHGQGVGTISHNFTYTFADDSSLSGASSNVGNAIISVTGQVYSGNMIWTGSSGNFSADSNWNDASDAAVHVAPGLDVSFAGVDSATFGNGTGSVTVTLNGSSPSLNSITFNNTGSYTLAQGSGGNITLAGTAPSITANGEHAISAPIILAANASMNVTGGNLTVSGAISGSGNLTKSGGGTLALSGANTYTGPTNVTAGTLLANNTTGSATGSGNVTVATGATLGGTGTIGGATTVQSGGTLAPGTGTITSNATSSPGVVAFSGGLTLETGSTFTFALTGNTTTGRGTDFSGVNVTGGNLTIGSAVNFNAIFNLSGSTVNFSDTFWDANQHWLVVQNAYAPSTVTGIFASVTASSDSFGNGFDTTGGTLSFSKSGNDIYLDFSFMPPVPEPSTWVAMAALTITGGFIGLSRRMWQIL